MDVLPAAIVTLSDTLSNRLSGDRKKSPPCVPEGRFGITEYAIDAAMTIITAPAIAIIGPRFFN